MSFGYGVGDVVALSQLAWKTYKACKDAPTSFANLAQETQSLHAVLKETEEVLTDSQTKLTPAQQRRLKGVTDGCHGVLNDLDALLQKYDSLGTRSKMSWDRMGYATKNTAELRSRLISHTLLLSSFIQTSQVVVEQKLRKLIKEVQEGKLGGSQLSVNSQDSLNDDERKRWRTIRKQLEAVGVTIAAFEENSAFIVDYIKAAIASGALEEKPPDSTPSATATSTATAPKIQTSAAVQKPSRLRSGSRTIPTPTPAPKRFSGRWKKGSNVTQVSVPQEPPLRRDHKILMLGISEAGKTTVLNQIRLLSGYSYSFEEYDNCRRLLWNTLVDDFILVLNELSGESQWRAIDIVYRAPRLEYGDEEFPYDVLDALHILWDEPTFCKVIDRGPELNLSANIEYFYKNMERIADPAYRPSNDDVLNIRVRTLGVADTIVEFNQEKFSIFDVPGERTGRNKWIYCFEGEQARCVTFVASLTGYCSSVESTGVNQLVESLTVFDSLAASKWFPESIFVLFLTKLDIFRKSMRNHPIEHYDSSFSYPSLEKNSVAHGLAFIANKFVALAEKHNRILQVHSINATSPLSQECLEEALRFISSTIPGRPSNGTGRLMPCPQCRVNDLFSLDHFEVPSEPHDFDQVAKRWDNDDEDVILNADNLTSPSARETVGVAVSTNASDPENMMSPQILNWKNINVKEEIFRESST